MRNRTILVIGLLFVVGCGGGGGSNSTTETQQDNNSEELSQTGGGQEVGLHYNPDPQNVYLKVTGQTQSYGSGEENTTLLRDDGYYQIGFANEYSRDASTEIVTDHLLGLMWQDNSEVATVELPWSDELGEAPLDDLPLEKQSSATTAQAYCSELELGGYRDWRVPLIEELGMMMDYSQTNTTHSIFKNLSDKGELSFYWSATPSYLDSETMWTLNPSLGQIGYETSLKMMPANIRCVRGESGLVYGEMPRDQQGIVTDEGSRLMWQDNYDSEEVNRATWGEAIAYCEALTLGEYGDWRLPNINELLSISNFRVDSDETILFSSFQNSLDNGYWSSTTKVEDNGSAYLFNYTTGSSTACKCASNAVRCVRTKG